MADITRRGFLGTLAAAAAFAALGKVVGDLRVSHLGGCTAEDIIYRYPQIRKEIGKLTWSQARTLIQAIVQHSRDNPGKWTWDNGYNVALFAREHLDVILTFSLWSGMVTPLKGETPMGNGLLGNLVKLHKFFAPQVVASAQKILREGSEHPPMVLDIV